MLASIILGLIGLIFVILGLLIWEKEKISLFHEYHYNHVSEEISEIQKIIDDAKDKNVILFISFCSIVIISLPFI